MAVDGGVSIRTLLLTLDEVAEQLRCTRRTVERLIAARTLPVVKIGRSARVSRRDLEQYVESLGGGAA